MSCISLRYLFWFVKYSHFTYMNCYYLNVHFQGQRVKQTTDKETNYIIRRKAANKIRLLNWAPDHEDLWAREYSCKVRIRRRFTVRPLYSRERFCSVETAKTRLAVCTTSSIATEGGTLMCRGGMYGHGTEGASLGNVHGW
jgi:hypothetical protein